MKGRAVAIVVAFIAFWVIAWVVATAPGRRSSEILDHFKTSTAQEAGPFLRDLTKVYTDSPRQAGADYASNRDYRLLIAQAAAPVPDCLPVVESALQELPPNGRLGVLLALAINGIPTLDERGAWSGKDTLQPRPDAVPAIRRLLERETEWPIAVMAASALAAAGDKPAPDVVFERARDMKRSHVARSAEVIILADRKGGIADLIRALQESLIPDDVATAVVISGVLDRDPGWKAFALSWATNPAHAAAAGGAFPTLYDLLPGEREQIWGTVNAAPRGRRVPLMLALMKRSGWPSSYRFWWMGVYDEEKKAIPDLEDQLATSDLGSFARWATEEKDAQASMAIRAVLERLRAAKARQEQR